MLSLSEVAKLNVREAFSLATPKCIYERLPFPSKSGGLERAFMETANADAGKTEANETKLTRGPTTIRTENGQLAVYIFVDIRDRDLGGYVADAKAAVAANVQFTPGSYVVWSGQFEYLERARAKLKIVVPVTLLIIFLLLYLNFRRLTETLIVML